MKKIIISTFTQLDQSAPVVLTLRNTFGSDIYWTRFELGKYRGTIQGVGEFVEGRTLCFATPATGDLSSPKTGIVQMCRTSDTEVELWTNVVDNGVAQPEDYQNLLPLSIRIETYP